MFNLGIKGVLEYPHVYLSAKKNKTLFSPTEKCYLMGHKISKFNIFIHRIK